MSFCIGDIVIVMPKGLNRKQLGKDVTPYCAKIRGWSELASYVKVSYFVGEDRNQTVHILDLMPVTITEIAQLRLAGHLPTVVE